MDTYSAVMDVEAGEASLPAVTEDVMESDLAAVHGDGWKVKALPVPAAAASDPAVESLVQWLGRDAFEAMSAREVDALLLALSRMPEHEPASSFAWDAVRKPDDVEPLAGAVVAYRRFDPGVVAVSEAMGGNDRFRKAVRSPKLRGDMRLGDLAASEAAEVAGLEKLEADVLRVTAAMKALFGDRPFTAAETVVAVAAAPGLARGMHLMAKGLAVSAVPSDDVMESFDRLRRRLVSAAAEVRAACGADPILFSPGVLSGVRRSLAERKSGDFRFAVEALGGRMEDGSAVAASAAAFSEFFVTADAFRVAMESEGLAASEEAALVGRLLVRRCILSAARGAGIDGVAGNLVPRAGLEAAALREIVGDLDVPSVAARVSAGCRDLAVDVETVAEAIRRAVTARRYRVLAASRVAAACPGVTVAQVRAVVEAEPAIGQAREVLKSFGGADRHDVECLERHLEWMIAAYALPVSDEAVERIVETRGGCLPMRLPDRALLTSAA